MTDHCSFIGCERDAVARGLCNKHWKQWRATVTELPPSPRTLYGEAGCTVDGCDAPLKARGLCNKHYKQATYPRLYKPTVEERFNAKVAVRGPDECWLWTANATTGNYGLFHTVGNKTVQAHRFAYELAYGNIPDGLAIDHTCHNGTDCVGGNDCLHRLCCNPAHLEAVTPAENYWRSHRVHGNLTHCPNGHEYADNMYTFSRQRRCRTCHLEAGRKTKTRSG